MCAHIHTVDPHIFFIHLSICGPLGCLHVLAIVNSAAVNIGVHISFQIIRLIYYLLARCIGLLPPQWTQKYRCAVDSSVLETVRTTRPADILFSNSIHWVWDDDATVVEDLVPVGWILELIIVV